MLPKSILKQCYSFIPVRISLVGLSVILATLAICFGLAAVSAHVWRTSLNSVKPSKAESLMTTQTQKVGAEQVRVTNYGFEPTEIRRPKGPFILLLNHLTSLPEVTLHLNRETGSLVREVGLKQFGKRRKQTELLDLPPGRYVLTEVSNPNWMCSITITPQ